MEKARLALPARGITIRRRRLFSSLLVAAMTLGLAAPAQAGLGDLLDPLVEDLPVVDEVVEPIVDEVVDPVVEPIVEDLIAPVVEEVVEPITPPVVDEVMQPIIDEVLPPEVTEVVPPVDEVDVPPVDEVDVPPVVGDLPVAPIDESVTRLGTSDPRTVRDLIATYDDLAPPNENVPVRSDQSVTSAGDERSLGLAQALQASLSRRAMASPIVSGSLVQSLDRGWLKGLTDWLGTTGNRLADLLAIPLRLLEILVRALLTAGSGLVAPASLALAFTIYAVRDWRWQGLRRTALH